MPMIRLTLDSLKDLDDGRALVSFTKELRKAVLDCIDRPGEEKPRTVSLVMDVTPVMGEEGMCEGATGKFRITNKTPDRTTKPYSFAINKLGDLIFSSNSPDNVQQLTLDDIDPKTGKISR